MKPLNILRKLEEIIKRDFQVHPIGGQLQLEEPEAKGYPTTLLKKKGNVLAYNFDVKNSNTAVFPFFNADVPSLTTIADYIIFYPHGSTLFVFVCNLKSNNHSNASEQAQAGMLFSQYLLKTIERLLKYPYDMQIEYRSLIFTTNQNMRFSTNVRQEAYNVLGRSGLKSKILKAGENCFLDALCF